VWYNPDGIANIISLVDAKKYFRVHYDSKREKAFVLEKPDGSTQCYVKTADGLTCFDTVNAPHPELGTALVTTVDDKKSKYTVRAYRQEAMLAHKLQTMIEYPSTETS
jgi:hypothetical protein